MNNRNLVKGVFLMAIALAFGLQSLRYPIGQLGRAGPGMFPLMISSLLALLGLATVVRALLTERVPMAFQWKNIGLVLLSLCGFAVLSEHVNMMLGIVFMVFCSTLAGSNYSVVRNLKICAGLIVVAFAFWKGLGLQLPLY
ncbi:MAG TPA: tripartite tricarboxylate transporter TctB family protein [Casimicrobiaceae bacterium]|nr:tripartite tricarboxylate transporter TctB family protein [Casimicrobiaceae bacterium]